VSTYFRIRHIGVESLKSLNCLMSFFQKAELKLLVGDVISRAIGGCAYRTQMRDSIPRNGRKRNASLTTRAHNRDETDCQSGSYEERKSEAQCASRKVERTILSSCKRRNFISPLGRWGCKSCRPNLQERAYIICGAWETRRGGEMS